MDALLQDLRFALRTAFRQPTFGAVAVFALALGIGATTAIFSVVDTVVLRQLPYASPDRIVNVANRWTKTGQLGQASAPDFHDWHDQATTFDALAYYAGGETSVTAGGQTDYATAIRVTPGFFRAMGADAKTGRLFTAEEETAGGPRAAVISDAFWKRRFNADPGVLGQPLTSAQRVFTIVGVLPEGFRFPARTDIWYPAAIVPEPPSRSAHNYRVVGRLKPSVTVEQAGAELAAIAARLEQQFPDSNNGKSATAILLQDSIVGDVRLTLYLLLGAVSFILLIACANVANLLLARATARRREIAVRAALGAGRVRLVRQLLTESLLLAGVSAVVAVILAHWGVRALVAIAPPDLPRLDEVAIDGPVLGFALIVAIAASVIFGLVPALHASRADLNDALRQGGKGAATGGRTGWLRSAFVVAEIALAMVLVISASLLGRSLLTLLRVDMGFNPERLIVLQTAVPSSSLEQARKATDFYRELLPTLGAVAGVTSVSAVRGLPGSVSSNGGYRLESSTARFTIDSPQAVFTVVAPQYFRTMGIAIVRGRDFADVDGFEAPPVAIVNQSLVRATFADGVNPIGQRLQCGLDRLDFMTIVGIVSDVRAWGPSRPPTPEIYMPVDQHPLPSTALTIVVRTASDPAGLGDALGRAIRSQNPNVAVRLDTMEGRLSSAVAAPRFRAVLLGIFAAVALGLAIAGVYGVMAYVVSQRVSEIGVRIALGASNRDVLWLVFAQGARLTVAGLALGMVISFAVTRLLSTLLFDVTARDPLVYVVVGAALVAAALGACYAPARRAMRVDPMMALRAE